MFRRIVLEQWRQIEKIDVKFDEQLTVLTGANGSGKTTLLNILSGYFGWNPNFVSLPSRRSGGKMEYRKSLWRYSDTPRTSPVVLDDENRDSIGKVMFKDKTKSALRAKGRQNEEYSISIGHKGKIKGVHIPSHRPPPNYEKVKNIPTSAISRKEAFKNYNNEIQNRSSRDRLRNNPGYHIKKTLISWALYGPGNEHMESNNEASRLFNKFQGVLANILPDELGFNKVDIRPPEVVLDTDSGDFSLDAASGGVASIISIAWRIFLFDVDNSTYAVTIDEPENHLHPRLQRSLLPNLVDTFPSAQFIVATHSPLIVGSHKDSRVYVLKFKDNNKVHDVYLSEVSKSGTSNEILRDVLGVSNTMPIWAEKELQRIISDYQDKELTEETLDLLRDDLEKSGLDNEIADAIYRIKN